MTWGVDQTWIVEVLNVSKFPWQLPGGTKIAKICPHEGTATAVNSQQWKAME